MEDESLYQSAKTAADRVLLLLEKIGWHNNKGLRNQIERAACSVPANITEGINRMIGRGKALPRAKLHFFRIALGSLAECICHLERLQNVRPLHTKDIKGVISNLSALKDLLVCVVDLKNGKEQFEIGWSADDPSLHLECSEVGRTCYVRVCESCSAGETMSVDRDGVRYFYFCSECQGGECEIVFPDNASQETIWRVEEEKYVRGEQLRVEREESKKRYQERLKESGHHEIKMF